MAVDHTNSYKCKTAPRRGQEMCERGNCTSSMVGNRWREDSSSDRVAMKATGHLLTDFSVVTATEQKTATKSGGNEQEIVLVQTAIGGDRSTKRGFKYSEISTHEWRTGNRIVVCMIARTAYG